MTKVEKEPMCTVSTEEDEAALVPRDGVGLVTVFTPITSPGGSAAVEPGGEAKGDGAGDEMLPLLMGQAVAEGAERRQAAGRDIARLTFRTIPN